MSQTYWKPGLKQYLVFCFLVIRKHDEIFGVNNGNTINKIACKDKKKSLDLKRNRYQTL